MCIKISHVLFCRYSRREVQGLPAKVKQWCILTPLSGLPPPTDTIQTALSQAEPPPVFALLSMPALSRSPHPATGLLTSHLLLERSSLLWRRKSAWLRLALTCPWVLRARIKKGPPSFTAPSLQPELLPARTATPLTAPRSLYPPPPPAALPLTLFHQRTVQQGMKINLHQALNYHKTVPALWKIQPAVVRKASLWAVVRYPKTLQDRTKMFLTSAPNPQTRSKSRLKTLPVNQCTNIYPNISPHLTGLQHLPRVSPKLFQNLCSFCGPLLFGRVIKSTRAGRCSRTTIWLVQRSSTTLLRGFIRTRRGRNPGQCHKRFLPLSRVCPIPPPACRRRASCQAMTNQGETLGTSLHCTLRFSPTEWDYLNLS